MNRYLLTGSAIGTVVAFLALASPAAAQAVGTQVGETIDNTVTVNFTVGGEAQDAISDSDVVAIDRKVDLTLVRTDNTGTSVTPGANDQAVTFQLSNQSNDTLDFLLDADNVANGTASEITGTDNFDVAGGFTYYIDDGDGIFNPASDTLVPYVDNLASGNSVVIHVVSDIQTGLSNEDRAAIQLTATAADSGAVLAFNNTTNEYDVTSNGSGVQGAALSADTNNSANALTIDTVFADTNANGQTARDGIAFDTDDYFVFTAGLTAAKSSSIVASPIVGDASGTAIPGATIQYCLLVSNAAGGADATSVSLSDILPAEVTFDAGFGVQEGDASCGLIAPSNSVGSETGGTVTANLGTIANGTGKSAIFQAVIE